MLRQERSGRLGLRKLLDHGLLLLQQVGLTSQFLLLGVDNAFKVAYLELIALQFTVGHLQQVLCLAACSPRVLQFSMKDGDLLRSCGRRDILKAKARRVTKDIYKQVRAKELTNNSCRQPRQALILLALSSQLPTQAGDLGLEALFVLQKPITQEEIISRSKETIKA